MSETPEAQDPFEVLTEAKHDYAHGMSVQGYREGTMKRLLDDYDEAIASLRQRQEELERLVALPWHRAAEHAEIVETENIALRTQLQQAETALRRLLREATVGHAWVSSVYIEDVASAALAAPPADDPASSQEKP